MVMKEGLRAEGQRAVAAFRPQFGAKQQLQLLLQIAAVWGRNVVRDQLSSV